MLFSWMKTLGEYLRGFFLYGMLEGIHGEKRALDHLFMLGLFGPMIGFPGLFNYYHLRMIPFYMKRLGVWKRRILKERDFFDFVKE